MSTSTVNISFKKNLLKQIDDVAKEESRSRSELIREAARIYIERKKRWSDIFNFGDRQVSKYGITVDNVEREIKKFRSKISN